MRTRRFGRTTRASSALRRSSVWTAIQAVSGGITDEQQSLDLVAPADWEAGTGGAFQKGATLLRIRGWLKISSMSGPETARFVIGKFNIGETIPSPMILQTYIAEDLIWTMGIGAETIVDEATVASKTYLIDVKSKRKLDSNSTIKLVYELPAGQTGTFEMICRALLRVS